MNNSRKLIAVCCLLAAFLSSCKKPDSAGISAKNGKIIAKVNGVPITEVDLNFRLNTAQGAHKAPVKAGEVLDRLIVEELLYQHGLKIGLDKDAGYLSEVARLERQLANGKRAAMTRRVYDTQVTAKINISNQDAKAYYDRNVNHIINDLHLEMVWFNTKEQAEEALKKIRNGATFESIARGVMGNQAMTGQRPWDLGFLSWDQIPVDFAAAVSKLKPGEVSEVVKTRRIGYQIFKLVKTRKNPKADFNSVSAVIVNRLQNEKVREVYERYVEGLKKESRIVKY